MTDAVQTANPADARNASMSRVVTQETILSQLTTPQAAQQPAEVAKTPEEPRKDGEAAKPKKTATERFHELAAQRREAEAKAEATLRENAELRSRLSMLEARAAPLEEDPRPIRSAFTSDESYEDALAKWGGRQAIKEESQRQATARAEAEQAEIAAQWSKRQDKAMKELPDYTDVLGAAEVSIPNHIFAALQESEMGPWVAYFLAMPENADEVKRLREMRPLAALRRLNTLERELSDIHASDVKAVNEEKPAPQVQKSKAPEPITPPRSTPAAGGPTTDFASYRARRRAEQAEARRR